MTRRRLLSPGLVRLPVAVLLLFLAAAQALSAGTRARHKVPSPSMGRTMKIAVVGPDDIGGDSLRLPVVYLLHGYGSAPRAWLQGTQISDLADSLRVIFVAAQGDRAGWWLDSPLRERSQFETHLTAELVPFIDSIYPTVADSSGRALLGSSMGGHGALTIRARHPDLFCAAVSISGVMDLTNYPSEWEIARVLGPLDQNRQRWQDHSFSTRFGQLQEHPGLIVIDCGRSDWVFDENERMHAALDSASLAHVWSPHPGGHTWSYVISRFGDLSSMVARYLWAGPDTPSE